MRNATNGAIQDQSFKAELIMRGVDVDAVADAIAGYFPGADVGGKLALGGYREVDDHLGRTWVVVARNMGEELVAVVTPRLSYEDIDDLLCLVEELKGAGARGGSGCGMRFRAFMGGRSEQSVRNLRNIVASKSVLLESALRTRFPTQIGEMGLDAEGFAELLPLEMATDLDLLEMRACLQLCCAITAQAVSQNRASAEVLRPENERYAFRCWMIRMGLTGGEYKPMRTRFLKRLDGDSSYRGGRPA